MHSHRHGTATSYAISFQSCSDAIRGKFQSWPVVSDYFSVCFLLHLVFMAYFLARVIKCNLAGASSHKVSHFDFVLFSLLCIVYFIYLGYSSD